MRRECGVSSAPKQWGGRRLDSWGGRRGLLTEEEHGRAHDGVVHAVVHDLGRANDAERVEEQTIDEEDERRADTERSVNGEVAEAGSGGQQGR